MAPSTCEAQQQPCRVLAIDYGRRRLGLALSDELGLVARPLATVERSNRRADLQKLARILKENGVGLILVGLPLRLDGTAGQMAQEARAFAARLVKATGLPVEMVDERLTSWAAEASLPRGTSGGAKRRAEIDQRAAILILEEYLHRGPQREQLRK